MKKMSLLSLLLMGALISPACAETAPEQNVEQPQFEGADDFDADIFDHISDDDLTRMIDIMKKEETWQDWLAHKAKGIKAGIIEGYENPSETAHLVWSMITPKYNEHDKELTAAAAGLAILAGCCGKRKTTAFFGALALASFYLVMQKSQSDPV